MAKDDYHVIVYQILAYLYTQLKAGEPVDGNMLTHDGPYFKINERYWAYVMETLVNKEFIDGVTITKPWGEDAIVSDLGDARITPEGIEFLCDNSFLQKAKQFLKDVKAIVPFV